MTGTVPELRIEREAVIPTWFGVGGRARRMATVRTAEELEQALALDPNLRVLGDGANLLVDDSGVSELVVKLDGLFTHHGVDEETGLYRAGGAVRLPKLILETIRVGLGGLEVLGGIPASVGGAVVMNAGGAFGQIADHVIRVHAIDRAGRLHAYDRSRIDFGYRQSRLNHLVVTSVEFDLVRGDPEALRERLKEVMAYKKQSQPLAENSAGCVFKNPVLGEDVRGLGAAGERVSAGKTIDLAGCKGLRVGGAEVSEVHANFFVTRDGATASDVIALMREVERRVWERFGVRLEREVVVWTSSTGAEA
jgi:UDP-N-acetylmuramate dehydrogenase